MKKGTGVKARILELAARPEGVGVSDFPGLDVTDASGRMCSMVTQGLLFRGAKGARNTRYFADPKAAEASAKAQSLAETKRPLATLGPLSKANFAKDAETVITAKTKVTICPPYKPRFEAHTLPFVQTANQAGRVVAEVEL
jgi:hypothetical protein